MSYDYQIDVLAVLRNETTKDSVIGGLTAMGNIGVRAGVSDLKKIDRDNLMLTPFDLLLLDVNLNDPAELTVLRNLVQVLPASRSIVVTAVDPTVEGMRHLMQLGIVDFVAQPITRNDLMSAFTSAIQRRQAGGQAVPEQQGKLLCFLGAGGGMGATTLTVQCACALAKPELPAKVLVVDLDIQFGNVSVYLDLVAKSSAVHLQHVIARVDQLMLRNAVVSHRCGVDVLATSKQMSDINALTLEGIARILYLARREYRHVLVDMPHVWTSWTRTVLGSADAIVLVLQSTVPSIRQAKRRIELLKEEGLEHIPLMLVLNRHEKGFFRTAQDAVTLKDTVKALGRDIPYTVANDYRVIQEAVNKGLPLAEVRGGKNTARQIAGVIKGLVGQLDTVESPTIVHQAS